MPFWANADAKKKVELPAWAAGLVGAQEFRASPGQMVLLRMTPGQGASRIILLGLGEPGKSRAYALAGWYATAFGALKNARCKKIGLLMPGIDVSESFNAASLSGLIASQAVMADYSFDKYKPRPEEGEPEKPQVERLVLVVSPADTALCLPSIQRGVLMGQAANFARSMQNEPANVATPAWVVEQAQEMAKKRKSIKLRTLGRPELKREKMNAMLAVAGEAAAEPKLLVLEYRGAPSRKGWDAAVVGKGVTFDSGGISIKPAQKMDEMKYDKSGACAAIGALMGAADLQLPLNVVGVAGLVENMPDAQSYRPGDILTACNGTTIEVLNTDAEGRLVLADALAWTGREYEPARMVDLATLTGACAVALGDLASGLLTRDDGMAEALVSAGEACGERLWRLPLWPEYDEKIKSEIATIRNIGEPGQAGTISAASFLRYFAGERAWAHIDIAATSDGTKPKSGLAPGGYGTGVRLVLEYLSAIRPEGKRK
ncbi:cytosol aminopeptidase [uncultured archaeon]|nr:cytosol aminopeptidase [uncultured archaeon]